MSEEGSQALWFEIVNNFNPSDSETQFPTLLKEKALKGIATAAALLASVAPLSACGESYSEPTSDATSTSQETQDPTPFSRRDKFSITRG